MHFVTFLDGKYQTGYVMTFLGHEHGDKKS
jgi:hypothetical protein